MELYTCNNFLYKKEDGVFKYLYSPIIVNQSLPFRFLCNSVDKILTTPLFFNEFMIKREVEIKNLIDIKVMKKSKIKEETILEKLMKVGTDDYVKVLKENGLL